LSRRSSVTPNRFRDSLPAAGDRTQIRVSGDRRFSGNLVRIARFAALPGTVCHGQISFCFRHPADALSANVDRAWWRQDCFRHESVLASLWTEQSTKSHFQELPGVYVETGADWIGTAIPRGYRTGSAIVEADKPGAPGRPVTVRAVQERCQRQTEITVPASAAPKQRPAEHRRPAGTWSVPARCQAATRFRPRRTGLRKRT
jgi:hypothetical protein